MALTYSQLTGTKDTDGSIRFWANYALLPVDSILTNAQAFIYERLRAREMRIEAPVVIAAADDSMDVPSGFLDPVQLLLDGDSRPIDYYHENILGRLRDDDGALTDGTICRYAIVDEKLLFDVKSSEARTGFFWYYAIPASLAATSNETNFLTRRYPQLLLDACMLGALNFRKMYAERNDMLKIVLEGIDSANVAADLGRRGATMR